MENYKECHCCKKPSSYIGKLFWWETKLLCKNCMLEELLKNKIIFDNWYTNS